MSAAKAHFRKQNENISFEFPNPHLPNRLESYASFVFSRIAFPDGTPYAVRKNDRFYSKGDLNLVGLREHAEGELVIGVSPTQKGSRLTKTVCLELTSSPAIEMLGQACRFLRTCEGGGLSGMIEVCPDERIRTWVFFPDPVPSQEALSAVRRFKKESFISQSGGLFPLEGTDDVCLELPPHLDRGTGKWSRILTLEEGERLLEGEPNQGDVLNWMHEFSPDGAENAENLETCAGVLENGGSGTSGGEGTQAMTRHERTGLGIVSPNQTVSVDPSGGTRGALQQILQEGAPRNEAANSGKQRSEPAELAAESAADDLVAKPLSDSIPAVIGRLLDPAPLSIPTPSDLLNDLLNGGWTSQHLYLLAGPSGEGKTTFCSWVSDYAASREIPVLFVSFQLPTEQMAIYSLSRTARIDSSKIESRHWLDAASREDTGLSKRLISAGRRFFQAADYLHFSEAGGNATARDIETALRLVRKNAEVGENEPILVVVDSLCEVRPRAASASPTERTPSEMAQVMLELKRVAWKCNAAIVTTLDVPAPKPSRPGESLRDCVETDPIYCAAAPMADTAFVLDSRSIHQPHSGADSRNGSNWRTLDPLGRMLEEDGHSLDLSKAIHEGRQVYPLDSSSASTYARLVVMKNRGGGTQRQPVFRYERAYHDFEPIDLEELQTSTETTRKTASAA